MKIKKLKKLIRRARGPKFFIADGIRYPLNRQAIETMQRELRAKRAKAAAQRRLKAFYDSMVYGNPRLPYAEYYKPFGEAAD